MKTSQQFIDWIVLCFTMRWSKQSESLKTHIDVRQLTTPNNTYISCGVWVGNRTEVAVSKIYSKFEKF